MCVPFLFSASVGRWSAGLVAMIGFNYLTVCNPLRPLSVSDGGPLTGEEPGFRGLGGGCRRRRGGAGQGRGLAPRFPTPICLALRFGLADLAHVLALDDLGSSTAATAAGPAAALLGWPPSGRQVPPLRRTAYCDPVELPWSDCPLFPGLRPAGISDLCGHGPPPPLISSPFCPCVISLRLGALFSTPHSSLSACASAYLPHALPNSTA